VIRRALAFAILTTGLASCSFGPSDDQMAGIKGCTNVWRAQFPDLYGDKDEHISRRALAVMAPESIAFEENGDFEFRQPSDKARSSYAMQFECRGNIRERTVSVARVGNREARPSQGQVWSF